MHPPVRHSMGVEGDWEQALDELEGVEPRNRVPTHRERRPVPGLADATPKAFGYRSPLRWMRWNILLLWAVVPVLVVSAAVGNTDAWAAVLWALGVAWISYWFWFRIGTSIHCENGLVTWRAPFAKRVVPVDAINSSRLLSLGFERLMVRGAPSLMMEVSSDWDRFLASLNRIHPIGGFTESRIHRFMNRWWPGATLFRGYYEE